MRSIAVYPVVFILLLSGCGPDEKPSVPGTDMLNREIQTRLGDLLADSVSLNTQGIIPGAIHARFQDFLLISKDVENLQASIGLHNRYLTELCAKHQFNRSQLLELNTGMSLAEIDFTLKQNELQIFNQIWMQKLNKSVELKSEK